MVVQRADAGRKCRSRGGCGESWGASLVESMWSGMEVVVGGVVVGVVGVTGEGGGGVVVVSSRAIVGWWGSETGCGY